MRTRSSSLTAVSAGGPTNRRSAQLGPGQSSLMISTGVLGLLHLETGTAIATSTALCRRAMARYGSTFSTASGPCAGNPMQTEAAQTDRPPSRAWVRFEGCSKALCVTAHTALAR